MIRLFSSSNADTINGFQNCMSDYLFLNQSLSEPEYYGDLHVVYKYKTIIGGADFSDQFRQIMICHRRIGYNLNVM